MNVLELSEQEIIRRNSLNELRAMGIDAGTKRKFEHGLWDVDAQMQDRKSTRLNSSHEIPSRMPSSA